MNAHMNADDHQQIRQCISTFIATELLDDAKAEDINATPDLLRTNMLDSLGVMRLVQFIHDDLAIDVPAEDVTLDNFRNVDCIVQYLTGRP